VAPRVLDRAQHAGHGADHCVLVERHQEVRLAHVREERVVVGAVIDPEAIAAVVERVRDVALQRPQARGVRRQAHRVDQHHAHAHVRTHTSMWR
jgi:hypothetical protein